VPHNFLSTTHSATCLVLDEMFHLTGFES